MATADSSIPRRRCTKCKREFPATLEFFSPQKKGKYGLRSSCRSCVSQQRREYREANVEVIRAKNNAYMKSRYDTDPDHFRQISRANYAKNPQAWKARVKAYQLRHPDLKKHWQRGYQKRKPLVGQARLRARRARMKSAEGTFTASDVSVQYERQRGLCFWCGIALNGKYEIDHIIPVSRGGSNWPDNICCSCRQCNRSKGNRLPQEWKGAK